MRLILHHPHVAARSCFTCKTYIHDDSPTRMGEIVMLAGKPVPRIADQNPPCRWCPKIPKGAEPVPENAEELSERNWLAYQHYLECKAVGKFPGDSMVRRNAMLIRQVEDSARRMQDLSANVREILAFVVGSKRS